MKQKPKYIQMNFPFVKHMVSGRPPEMKYIPPEPSGMTDADLEKYFIICSHKKAKTEIIKRIKNGSKFRCFRLEKRERAPDKLVMVFDDPKVNL